MTLVAVVRPGWSDLDEQQRLIGSLDVPLNARGEQQVRVLIARLKEFAPDLNAILTGVCHPARGTALSIGDAFGISVRESEELNNVQQGLWQGSAVEEIRRKMPRIFKQWEEAPETICPPEGEAWEAAVDRVRRALKKPLRKFAALAVVASEPLAALVSSVLTGQPPDLSAAFPDEPVEPFVEIFESAGRDSPFERRQINRETENGEC